MTDSSKYDPTPDKEPQRDPRTRKDAKKRRTPEQRAILNQRIEQVRAMLRLSMTVGEIKRTMSQSWGIKSRSVEWYITQARKRNHEHVEVGEDQLLSETLDYWAKKKQEAERDAKKFRDKLDWAQSEIDTAHDTINAVDFVPTEEQLETAWRRLKVAQSTIGSVRYLYEAAAQKSMQIQKEMDRLLGVAAPVKHTQTTTDGQDVFQAAPKTPESPLHSQEQLNRLKQLYEEGIARKAKPSEN